MDDFFLRELIIFIAIALIFIGLVPLLIRGHHSERIEVAVEKNDKAESMAAGQVRLSKKRRARKRDATKKKG